MKALVGVKRVLDYSVKVRVNRNRTAVDLAGLKMSVNPFCEIAMEEAVKLREKKVISEVTAISIGDAKAVDTLRVALAMGADNAIHVKTDMKIDSELQPLAVAKVFTKII